MVLCRTFRSLLTTKIIFKVPVSKEDIFSTDSIALIDKRKLMRFLTFAMNEETDPQVLEGELS
jgi:RAB protein geranylgeranyltransferase component A